MPRGKKATAEQLIDKLREAAARLSASTADRYITRLFLWR